MLHMLSCARANKHKWNVCHQTRDLLGERVEAIRLLGVGKGHSHAGRQGGVKHHGAALVPGRQVHGGDGTNALSVQDDILRADAIPDKKNNNNNN